MSWTVITILFIKPCLSIYSSYSTTIQVSIAININELGTVMRWKIAVKCASRGGGELSYWWIVKMTKQLLKWAYWWSVKMTKQLLKEKWQTEHLNNVIYTYEYCTCTYNCMNSTREVEKKMKMEQGEYRQMK